MPWQELLILKMLLVRDPIGGLRIALNTSQLKPLDEASRTLSKNNLSLSTSLCLYHYLDIISWQSLKWSNLASTPTWILRLVSGSVLFFLINTCSFSWPCRAIMVTFFARAASEQSWKPWLHFMQKVWLLPTSMRHYLQQANLNEHTGNVTRALNTANFILW